MRRRAYARAVTMYKKCAAFAVLLVTLAIARAAPPPAKADHDFSQYEGRVVLLDFWASWCPPCKRSFPWFNEMQKKYGPKGLVIVGVNTDAKWADAERFLQSYPAEFQLVHDPEGKLSAKFGVTGMPTTFVFDRHGEPIAKHLGFEVAKKVEYEETLRNALAADPGP
jgi:thiol-disulfide isomerase/thioredoxin